MSHRSPLPEGASASSSTNAKGETAFRRPDKSYTACPQQYMPPSYIAFQQHYVPGGLAALGSEFHTVHPFVYDDMLVEFLTAVAFLGQLCSPQQISCAPGSQPDPSCMVALLGVIDGFLMVIPPKGPKIVCFTVTCLALVRFQPPSAIQHVWGCYTTHYMLANVWHLQQESLDDEVVEEKITQLTKDPSSDLTSSLGYYSLLKRIFQKVNENFHGVLKPDAPPYPSTIETYLEAMDDKQVYADLEGFIDRLAERAVLMRHLKQRKPMTKRELPRIFQRLQPNGRCAYGYNASNSLPSTAQFFLSFGGWSQYKMVVGSNIAVTTSFDSYRGRRVLQF